MLNLDRLRALHAVSAHGSIIAAAETLNVTTSAVSQQLAKLESETGQTLLERHGRGVRLTDAAAALVLRTHRVLSLLEEAEAELDANETAVAGQITIAAFATAARGLAPQAIRALRKKYPQLGLTFHEQEPHDSIPRLVRRDVDVIIINDWENAPIALPDGLTKAPLFDDVADIALPPGHPLAKAKTIKLRRCQRRGVDRVAVRIDLPRLPDAHAAHVGPRAEDRAHRRRIRNPTGAGGGGPRLLRVAAAGPRHGAQERHGAAVGTGVTSSCLRGLAHAFVAPQRDPGGG